MLNASAIIIVCERYSIVDLRRALLRMQTCEWRVQQNNCNTEITRAAQNVTRTKHHICAHHMRKATSQVPIPK